MMLNERKPLPVRKKYSLSNKLLLQFIDKIPPLTKDNKATEFLMEAQLADDGALAEKGSLKDANAVKVNIRFSYDFVMDRWFMNDPNIIVEDREW